VIVQVVQVIGWKGSGTKKIIGIVYRAVREVYELTREERGKGCNNRVLKLRHK
jgi:hypothetical protein